LFLVFIFSVVCYVVATIKIKKTTPPTPLSSTAKIHHRLRLRAGAFLLSTICWLPAVADRQSKVHLKLTPPPLQEFKISSTRTTPSSPLRRCCHSSDFCRGRYVGGGGGLTAQVNAAIYIASNALLRQAVRGSIAAPTSRMSRTVLFAAGAGGVERESLMRGEEASPHGRIN
jgi:hypothetical protein